MYLAKVTCALFLLLSTRTYSQELIDDIGGKFWVHKYSEYDRSEDDYVLISYDILFFSDSMVLSVITDTNFTCSPDQIYEEYYCTYRDMEDVYIEDKTLTATHIDMAEKYEDLNEEVLSWFSYVGKNTITIGNSKAYIYDLKDTLPYHFYESFSNTIKQKELLKYFFEKYFDQEVRAVCVDGLELYRNKATNPNPLEILSQGDLVEVLHRFGIWTWVRSLRTGVIGWTKEDCFDESE